MDKQHGQVIGHESESFDHIGQCKGICELCSWNSRRYLRGSVPTRMWKGSETKQLDVLTVCTSTELKS